MTKTKHSSAVAWNPVVIDGSLFNSNNADGLIGIEECLDYDSSAVISNKKVRKRTFDEKKLPGSQTKQAKKDSAGENKKKTRAIVGKVGTDKVKSEKTKRARMGTKTIDDQGVFSVSKEGATNFDVSTTATSDDNSNNDQDGSDSEDFSLWSTFGLADFLMRAVKEQGFHEPTAIQALTLPAAIFGRRDILGAAETGSGKTLAFGLPILNGILEWQRNCAGSDDDSKDPEDCRHLGKPTRGQKPLLALILTPTRELAMQVKNHLTAAAKYTGIKIAVVLGGMAVVKQERILSKGPEIVVATPGRLWELIREGNEHLSQINDIRYLAIDETDRMLEKGHFKELQELLQRLNADPDKRTRRQNFVFSATLTLVHELPRHLALKKRTRAAGSGRKITQMSPAQKLQAIVELLGISDPKIVDVTQKTGTAATLSECRITCPIDEKDFYVYYFLRRHPGRTIIFCNSIGCVRRLTALLGVLECCPLPLHSSMQQRQRLKNLDRFRANSDSILIATDVAARGLDIPHIDHVLHYQTPRTSESYVHRSGRTARASREGITVLLVEPTELHNYLRLCRTLGRTEDLPIFPVEAAFFKSVKQRVTLARDLEKLELQVKKANMESGWIQRAAEEMDIIVDDMTSPTHETKHVNAVKKAAVLKRKVLAEMLRQPLFPKTYSGKYPLQSNMAQLPRFFSSFGANEEQKKPSAIDVLKNSVNNGENQRGKNPKWLGRKNNSRKRKSDDVIVEATAKKKRNKKAFK